MPNDDFPTTDETTNTKLQTPDNVQSSSSKAPTSREKSGCGDWEIFGVWCLNIGIWNFVCSKLQRSGVWRGSQASRRPSPRKLRANNVDASVRAGKTIIHQ